MALLSNEPLLALFVVKHFHPAATAGNKTISPGGREAGEVEEPERVDLKEWRH